jgi:hypothetical protein
MLKSSRYWGITPCNVLKPSRGFGGILRLLLQGRRISQARNQYEAGNKQRHSDNLKSNIMLMNFTTKKEI